MERFCPACGAGPPFSDVLLAEIMNNNSTAKEEAGFEKCMVMR
jgi:hypothetical protein